ncbi:galactose-1-phosphate uridylyltransferase [compost metagenome]
MGLAILPGRLKDELDDIAGILAGDAEELQAVRASADHRLAQHAHWIEQLVERFGTSLDREEAIGILRNEVGLKFAQILEHAGVYKVTPEGRAAFRAFLKSFGTVQ